MEAVYEYQSNSTNNQFYATTNPMYRTKLWNDSQITINNVSPFLSFSKEKRFKWSSIYWPDSSEKSGRTNNKGKSDIHQAAKKISKMIDDEQKDQERMRMVKRTLSLGKSQLNSARKEVHNVLSTKKPFQLSKQTERIVNRLAPVMIKRQSLLRDRHGNRCNLFSNPEEEEEKQGAQYFAESTGFKTSRKIKLQLPHNYFPGPGTYEIKRYLADLDIKSACISLKSSDKQQLKKEQS